MPRAFVMLGLSLLAGCGGATKSDLFNADPDASVGDASGGADGAVTDGSRDARSDAPSGNCQSLLADLADKRGNALKCDATSSAPACGIQVEDFCCPLSVTGPASRQVVAEFLAALKVAKAANCPVACTAVPCSSQPSSTCSNNGSCLQF